MEFDGASIESRPRVERRLPNSAPRYPSTPVTTNKTRVRVVATHTSRFSSSK